MMDDESEQGLELYINDGVLVVNHTSEKNSEDFLNNLGTLSIVEYKSGLGKCIEWNHCDVSIEADDQEWAIVRDSKCQNGTSNESTINTKSPAIQIPLKNLLSFKVNKNGYQLILIERGSTKSSSTTFYFQNGQVNYFVDVLTKYLNTTVSKKDLNLYIVRDQREVQALEKSFAELDLFSDDNTRSDAIWGFIKKLHDHPYETTMNAFCKVTDAFYYKPVPREIDSVGDILSKSLAADDVSEIHGRISTEDYELITKGTPLPPRTLPFRSPPLSLKQWSIMFDQDGRITDSQTIKEQIFHGGISLNLRSEVWKFLLDYYPWDSTFTEREAIKKQKKEEYFTMKLQWKTITPLQENNFTAYKERKSLIEKDVCRTDRNIPYFSGNNNLNLETLQDILMTYVMYNFDLGYVQGMSDLLSPLLAQLNDEVDTFWCFVGFMTKVIRNFDLDQAGMKQQLQQLYCILCCVEPELAIYLEHQDSNNMSFCFRWLLIWFKREFSYDEIFILWEILWTGVPCKNFHLLICAAILDSEKDTLMSNNYGFTEILKHVNELAKRINLDMILRKAEGIYMQLTTAAKIPSAVREIIGLDPLPEDEEEKEDDPTINDVSNNDGDTFRSQNGDGGQNSHNFSIDPQELEFDNSISLQYL